MTWRNVVEGQVLVSYDNELPSVLGRRQTVPILFVACPQFMSRNIHRVMFGNKMHGRSLIAKITKGARPRRTSRIIHSQFKRCLMSIDQEPCKLEMKW